MKFRFSVSLMIGTLNADAVDEMDWAVMRTKDERRWRNDIDLAASPVSRGRLSAY
jgi:hypothetical protein